MAPVIEIWVGLKAILLCGLEEDVMQFVMIPRTLHMHCAANTMHSIHSTYIAKHASAPWPLITVSTPGVRIPE